MRNFPHFPMLYSVTDCKPWHSSRMDTVKILIIEDEQKIADTLQLGLEENGYEVDIAYDGESGLRRYFSARYHLVILDINLPGLNGLELCKIMRKENAAVFIIMLTSMNTMANKEEGYDAGADDYIVKPFEFRELLLKIGAYVKRVQQEQAGRTNILRAPNLEMHLDSREVFRSNQKIALTVKEFQLLEYLLYNQNKVLSRAEIAINVWGIDFDTNTNVIDVYISYLRNKIDKHFSPKLIHTQVGLGYMLKSREN